MHHPIAETPGEQPSGAGSPKPKALLIDASAAARYALRLRLQALGAEVRQARSVEQALPILDSERPDLIITAPVPPGMNALELLWLLRTSAGDVAPPVVIRCGDAHWPLVQAAVDQGATAVATDAELPSLLPALLRPPARREPVVFRAPTASPPRQPHGPIATAAETTAPLSPVMARHCQRLALSAALAGAAVGIALAWVLRG
jgi:CheY-like chemotaxis protein